MFAQVRNATILTTVDLHQQEELQHRKSAGLDETRRVAHRTVGEGIHRWMVW